MATYLQLQKQITELQHEADALRAAESAGVIDRIRDAIAHYGFTVEHLFGARPAKVMRGRKATFAELSESRRAANGAMKGMKAPIKFRDKNGNAWSGRGSQPRWLTLAVQNGAKLKDFKIG